MLSAASKKVAPLFYPLGLKPENWPGAVGLFTGLFAKESVVGTLDTLYTQMAATENRATESATEPEPFFFWAGIADAFKEIPKGFKGFANQLRNPLGVDDTDELDDAQIAAEKLGVQSSTVTALSRYFDGKVGAIAYLLFILIYAPCVAAIAAIYRETNLRWTIFGVSYLTSLAWIISTSFYQIGTFARHPATSAGWIAFCTAALFALYFGLRIKGRSTAQAV